MGRLVVCYQKSRCDPRWVIADADRCGAETFLPGNNKSQRKLPREKEPQRAPCSAWIYDLVLSGDRLGARGSLMGKLARHRSSFFLPTAKGWRR